MQVATNQEQAEFVKIYKSIEILQNNVSAITLAQLFRGVARLSGEMPFISNASEILKTLLREMMESKNPLHQAEDQMALLDAFLELVN